MKTWFIRLSFISAVFTVSFSGIGLASGLNSNTDDQVAPKTVLVVMSAENKITLHDGRTHRTGFFLSELMVPLMALEAQGYSFEIATPSGRPPSMDPVSDSAFWFHGDEDLYQKAKVRLSQLKELNAPKSLGDIKDDRSYAGIFVPGGHAPMEDLVTDQELGRLLRHFAKSQKAVGLICHGPIALLSTLNDPGQFIQNLTDKNSLERDVLRRSLLIRTLQAKRSRSENPQEREELDSQIRIHQASLEKFKENLQKIQARLRKLAVGFPFEGFRMTSFSTLEEMQEEEGGEDNVLGGFVRFYPDQALNDAGGIVSVGMKWNSHVIRDRFLVTGQNPFSDKVFSDRLLDVLRERDRTTQRK